MTTMPCETPFEDKGRGSQCLVRSDSGKVRLIKEALIVVQCRLFRRLWNL